MYNAKVYGLYSDFLKLISLFLYDIINCLEHTVILCNLVLISATITNYKEL